MSTFITRVELHGVLPAESQSIYDMLHAEMVKQKFRPTINSALADNTNNYHLPSAMYSGHSATLTARQVNNLAEGAVAATRAWAAQNKKKSVFTHETLTIRADEWAAKGMTPVQ